MVQARWLGVGLALLLGACSGRGTPPAGDGRDAPPPITPAELERGRALCAGYVARLCACVDKDPALRESCDLARAQPEELEMHVHLLEGKEGPLNETERRIAQASARKVIAACVHDDGALSLARCPR